MVYIVLLQLNPLNIFVIWSTLCCKSITHCWIRRSSFGDRSLAKNVWVRVTKTHGTSSSALSPGTYVINWRGCLTVNGQWQNDIQGMCRIAHQYFQTLFTASYAAPFNFYQLKSGGLSQSDLRQLRQLPKFSDIKDAVFTIGDTKSLGIDGISAYFYQNFWSLTGHEPARTIWNCCGTKTTPSWMNLTLVTLILKQSNIQHISQMQPISLYKTIYKLPAKLIVGK